MVDHKASVVEHKDSKDTKVATPIVTAVPFPRIDPRTGLPVQYQEVADNFSTTPPSEHKLATPNDTLQRLIVTRVAEILRQHGGSESNIASDHEYWDLKTFIVPPVIVADAPAA